MNKELTNWYYKITNEKYNHCLYGAMECQNEAINAHSIQNSQVFDLLNKEGHVFQIGQKKSNNNPPSSYWKSTGRTEASTFQGLCKKHDNDLFKPIDINRIDLDNDEQLFLLAYRSVLKELHVTINAASQLQKMYLKKIDLGLIAANDITDEGLLATDYIINAYETNLYKERFDRAFFKGNFKFVKHNFFTVNHHIPSVACSQLFSLDYIKFKDDVLRMVLNVFPTSKGKTVVVFSFTEEEKELAEDYLIARFEGDDFQKKYALSKTIIENTSNFFVNPQVISQWTELKKQAILDYFTDTVSNFNYKDSADYYLFE